MTGKLPDGKGHWCTDGHLAEYKPGCHWPSWHLGKLLAHIQLTVHQYTKVPFYQAAFQPHLPKPIGLPGVVVTKMQDPTLGPIETHTVNLGPSIQSIQVPL